MDLITSLVLNPYLNPGGQSGASPGILATAATLTRASFVVALFGAFCGFVANRCLYRHSHRGGWSMVERCWEFQCKFDFLEERQIDLFLKIPVVAFRIGTVLLLCAHCLRLWYLNSFVASILALLVVPGVVVCRWMVVANASS